MANKCFDPSNEICQKPSHLSALPALLCSELSGVGRESQHIPNGTEGEMELLPQSQAGNVRFIESLMMLGEKLTTVLNIIMLLRTRRGLWTDVYLEKQSGRDAFQCL